jgi:hypothetical protein
MRFAIRPSLRRFTSRFLKPLAVSGRHLPERHKAKGASHDPQELQELAITTRVESEHARPPSTRRATCYETGSTGRISPEYESAEKLFDRSGSVKQDRGDDTARGIVGARASRPLPGRAVSPSSTSRPGLHQLRRQSCDFGRCPGAASMAHAATQPTGERLGRPRYPWASVQFRHKSTAASTRV